MRGRDNRRKDVKIKMNGERNLRRWLCHPCILTFLLLLRPSSPYSPHTSMLLSSSSSEYFCTREVLRFQFTALLSQLLSFSFHHHYTPVLLCSPTSPCQSPTALRPLQSSPPLPHLSCCFSLEEPVRPALIQTSLIDPVTPLTPLKPCCLFSTSHFLSLFMFHLRSENFKRGSLKRGLCVSLRLSE